MASGLTPRLPGKSGGVKALLIIIRFVAPEIKLLLVVSVLIVDGKDSILSWLQFHAKPLPIVSTPSGTTIFSIRVYLKNDPDSSFTGGNSTYFRLVHPSKILLQFFRLRK